LGGQPDGCPARRGVALSRKAAFFSSTPVFCEGVCGKNALAQAVPKRRKLSFERKK